MMRLGLSRGWSEFLVSLGLVLLLCSLAAGQTTATWTGLGGDNSYNNEDNWDIGVVPVNNGTTYSVVIPSGVTVLFNVDSPQQIADLSLGTNSTLTINPGKGLSVLDDAFIYGIQTAGNSTFLAQAAGAQFPGNAARIQVTAGGQIAVAGTSYSSTGLTASNQTHTLLSAQGVGSTLDVSSLQSFNAGFNDGSGYVTIHRIEAINDGVIDLSALETVQGPTRSEDRLEFAVNTGGSIDLSSLQSTTSGYTKFDLALDPGTPFGLPALESAVKTSFAAASGTTVNLNALLTQDGGTYDIADGATVNAGAWTSANGVTLNVDAGGTLSAANLTTFTSSVLHRQPGQILTLPSFINIDNSKLSVSGGESLTVAATSYSSTGLTAANQTHTLFSASGTDGGSTSSSLDLSSLTSLDAGFNDSLGYTTVHRVEAVDGGQVDLSGVHNVVGPTRSEDRLDFVVSNGGKMSFGFSSMSRNVKVDVVDSASTLAVDGHLSLASTTTIGVTSAAKVELAGSFSFHHSDESDMNLDAGILDFVGGGTRFLEVGGEDVGVPAGGMTGNFGTGQLVLGSDGAVTTVVLLDAVDNLNRGTEGEALYLLGLSGPNGLRILNGSTLYIGDINVYTTELGAWVHVNDLFEPEETIIAYDDGYISIGSGPVKPGDANLDGLVQGADYTLWADNYQQPADWMSGDFTRDAWANGADYTIWADNYDRDGKAAVPEPASAALVALGAVLLIRRRRP